ncbi:hypothetical protein NLJ89_g2097 [Agrocybe chaxingu]|uniref:Cytochrome P450 n=1 Tax=Agrocybe chaxingu TaxID=84603 RepID=A0A9W8MYA8_9AGAR|nr:hypothetical protein NLJ89_g2097 [Agrocybe chaxingu]
MFSTSFLSSPSNIAGGVALGFVFLTCWKLIRRFVVRQSLDNLPGPPSVSFVTGCLTQLFNRHAWDYHQHLADNFAGVVKIKGLFGANCLYVHDPKALHHILLKDQYIYEETETMIQMNKMMFGEGIFTSLGERHRLQRKMLNPVFSIAHMRRMVPIFYEVSHRLHNTFVQIAKRGSDQEIDIIDWMTRLALELIGQSGLGFSFDSLAEGTEPHPYGIASKMLVPIASEGSHFSSLLAPIVAKFEHHPRLGRWIVDRIPGLAPMRFIVDTLNKTAEEIIADKKKAILGGDDALKDQIGEGNDVISILMRANMFAPEEEKLSEKELHGQVTSLTFAATDTTSGALTRTLHLLAMHKDAQEKVRKEIQDARKDCGGEDIPYDTLVHLPYLDAVCRETLRLYPPLAVINRTTRADVILPLGNPVKGIDGIDIHQLEIPNGTDVFISIIASNRNPEYWGPDALEWKPERWLGTLPQALVDSHIPETALALLLEDLEFSLPVGKEIHWQMNAITAPNTDRNGKVPTMPLKVAYLGK